MMKKLPIGVENFKKLRTEGYYYVDKTGLIRDLLNNLGDVNLFTRPRRFGKSLNMDMLRTFLDYGCDSALFDGLEIAEEERLCKEYMGKFPVISITMKDISARGYGDAKAAMCSVIGNEALKFRYLLMSEKLTDEDKKQYEQLIKIDQEGRQKYSMPDEVLKDSLLTLSKLLCKHYGQKTILLIDEYDVPLDKAHQAGYYDEMTDLVRSLLGRALKTNNTLQFAVLTGCLRIAKESIFTGLNNFKVYSISNAWMAEYFGFLDDEVKEMLKYYELADSYQAVRNWYDGYHIGNADIYCPWDVINYIDLLRGEPDAEPKAFWINSSGNDIIRRFLRMAKPGTRREIELLIDGGSIQKKVHEELTYKELYESIENVWSVLYTTGYLTKRGKTEGNICGLVIPNQEIRQIFIEQIEEWFQEEARKDTLRLDAFCRSFAEGDAEAVERQFNAYLKKTISIRDTAVRKEKKENFYHGILLGLLSCREDWDVRSNAESGTGYSDILVGTEDETGIVIEIKYAEDGNFEAACKKAMKQIEKKEYTAALTEDGAEKILKYGIACWKKRCKVIMEN